MTFTEWLSLGSKRVHTAFCEDLWCTLTLTESKLHNMWYDAGKNREDRIFILSPSGFKICSHSTAPTKSKLKERRLL